MLKISKKEGNYRTKSGNFQFVYSVKGTAEEMSAYNEHRELNGWQPDLFHSLSPLEIGTPIEQNYDGTKFIAKQDLEIEFEKAQQRKANAEAYVSIFSKGRTRISQDVEVNETIN